MVAMVLGIVACSYYAVLSTYVGYIGSNSLKSVGSILVIVLFSVLVRATSCC